MSKHRNIIIAALLSTACSAVFAMPALAETEAQPSTGYNDNNRGLTSTHTRANGNRDVVTTNGVTIPGYNPNVLRPAGDGFGAHRATEDISMQNFGLKSVSGIEGNGAMVISGLRLPNQLDDAASKRYVDAHIGDLTDSLDEDIGQIVDTINSLTGQDGVRRNGNVFSADNTVLRTSGSQSVSGFKTFLDTLQVTGSSSAVTPAINVSSSAAGTSAAFISATGQQAPGAIVQAASPGGLGVIAVHAPGATDRYVTFREGVATDASGAASGAQRGSIFAMGDGLMLDGVEWPEVAHHTANKEYVDFHIARLEALINPPAPPLFMNGGVYFGAITNEPMDPLMHFTFCNSRTMLPDGSATCDSWGHVNPAYPARPYFGVVEINYRAIYNATIRVVNGNCPLRDHIGLNEPFTVASGLQEIKTADEPFVPRYYGDLLPASFNGNTRMSGVGSITYGCSVAYAVNYVSIANQEYSRGSEWTISHRPHSEPNRFPIIIDHEEYRWR